MSRKKKCQNCKGTGEKNVGENIVIECGSCNGTGWYRKSKAK